MSGYSINNLSSNLIYLLTFSHSWVLLIRSIRSIYHLWAVDGLQNFRLPVHLSLVSSVIVLIFGSRAHSSWGLGSWESLWSNLSSDFLIFGIFHLIRVELISLIPAQSELRLFAGWIRYNQHERGKIFFPVWRGS